MNTNPSDFRDGEIVDITIKGARVVNSYGTGIGTPDGRRMDTGTVLVVKVDGPSRDDRSVAVNMASPGVTVERAAPAEWPPRAGDLWRRDDLGDVWFAVFDNYGRQLMMIPANPTKGLTAYEPGEVLVGGPLTLVHREESDR